MSLEEAHALQREMSVFQVLEEHEDGALDVRAGQALVTYPGEWVRYSTPQAGGAQYVAVCLPAFSPETVHRDEE